ncbi:MAG: hypothetical protein FJ137_02855 [Deltaproteobacteria bacterium]|nr:hypothetical protein [Deltaproteobacteria bacterium]
MRIAVLPLGLVVVPALGALVHAPRAEACSPAIAGVTRLSGETLPSAEAVDVPTNARIFFATTDGFDDGTPTATLQRGDDEPVSASVERVPGGLVLGNVTLAPSTTYTAVIDLFGPAPGDDLSVDPGVHGELVFTTGDGLDTTPPGWTGDAELAIEHIPGSGPFEYLFPSTCGTRSAFDVHTITPPALDDDVAVIELRTVADDSSTVVVEAARPGAALVVTHDDAVPVRYQLVAVDVAGNDSEPLVVEAPAVGGCSAMDGRDSGLTAAALAGLALLRRRRRR